MARRRVAALRSIDAAGRKSAGQRTDGLISVSLVFPGYSVWRFPMFSVGDKVVYPMHGAGLIEAVEERIYEEKPTQYLVLSMFLGNMKVRIPVCNLEKVGLRPIIPRKKMKDIQKVLETEVANNLKSSTWNRRFTIYIDKMKSGDVLDLAEVISILARQDKQKRLSTGERRLLGNARQILASEIMIVKNSNIESAEKWIDKALHIA